MKKKRINEKHLPKIGDVVRILMHKRHISQTDMAKRTGMAPSSLNRLLKTRNWDIAAILIFEIILQTPLLPHYMPKPTEDTVPASEVATLTTELNQLKEENAKLQNENTVLRAQVDAFERLLAKR